MADPSRHARRRWLAALALALVGAAAASCARPSGPEWEVANPLRPVPDPPLGIDSTFESLADPPTPERIRLGRWLFYDPRLSADGRVGRACRNIRYTTGRKQAELRPNVVGPSARPKIKPEALLQQTFRGALQPRGG